MAMALFVISKQNHCLIENQKPWKADFCLVTSSTLHPETLECFFNPPFPPTIGSRGPTLRVLELRWTKIGYILYVRLLANKMILKDKSLIGSYFSRRVTRLKRPPIYQLFQLVLLLFNLLCLRVAFPSFHMIQNRMHLLPWHFKKSFCVHSPKANEKAKLWHFSMFWIIFQ